MGKITHLQKILLVMVVTLTFSIGAEDWWGPVTVTLYMYYFAFVSNLFVKLYEKDNVLSKAFFGIPEMPLYIGIATVVLVVFLRKQNPLMNPDSLYINAFVGGFATTIARFKRGRFPKREYK